MNAPRALLVDLDDTFTNDHGGGEQRWRLVCADATARMRGLDAYDLFQEISR